MQDFLSKIYIKADFKKRFLIVLLAVIVMGFSLSWLVQVDFGTDPFTCLNIAIAEKIGTTLGRWQAIFNSILFVFVLAVGRKYIGFGTVANMLLVGYFVDFFSWVWRYILPEGAFDSSVLRVAVLLPALALFIFSVAVYIL